MNNSCPTGNGEERGPEYAGQAGTPLPGSRPDRARANCERNASDLTWAPSVTDEQAGFGKEDMECGGFYVKGDAEHASDQNGPAPDLAAMGNGGEAFGGS